MHGVLVRGVGGCLAGGALGCPAGRVHGGGHEVNLMERHRGLGPQVRSL